MLIYKSRFLVRGEVWFDTEPDDSKVDWILYRQRSRPVPGARWKYFYSRVLDLSLSPEKLLAQMKKTTAYEIRRGRDSDRVTCEWWKPATPAILDQFEVVYNQFAAHKGLGPLDRATLSAMAEQNALELSIGKDHLGKPLVYHVFYRDSQRSCFMLSASLSLTLSESAERNAIARANRFLLWSDLLRHKEQGLKIFDLGGWYPGNTDQELLNVNRFKEGFGGQVVREYNCEQIVTLKGLVVLTAAKLLDKAKGWSAHLKSAGKS